MARETVKERIILLEEANKKLRRELTAMQQEFTRSRDAQTFLTNIVNLIIRTV
jgi:hypothetical protein